MMLLLKNDVYGPFFFFFKDALEGNLGKKKKKMFYY